MCMFLMACKRKVKCSKWTIYQITAGFREYIKVCLLLKVSVLLHINSLPRLLGTPTSAGVGECSFHSTGWFPLIYYLFLVDRHR